MVNALNRWMKAWIPMAAETGAVNSSRSRETPVRLEVGMGGDMQERIEEREKCWWMEGGKEENQQQRKEKNPKEDLTAIWEKPGFSPRGLAPSRHSLIHVKVWAGEWRGLGGSFHWFKDGVGTFFPEGWVAGPEW